LLCDLFLKEYHHLDENWMDEGIGGPPIAHVFVGDFNASLPSSEVQILQRVNANGSFMVNNIIPGHYNMYTWIPGFLGDFVHNVTISISAGK
jgi:Polysaccharide lyase family 4, domain II